MKISTSGNARSVKLAAATFGRRYGFLVVHFNGMQASDTKTELYSDKQTGRLKLAAWQPRASTQDKWTETSSAREPPKNIEDLPGTPFSTSAYNIKLNNIAITFAPLVFSD